MKCTSAPCVITSYSIHYTKLYESAKDIAAALKSSLTSPAATKPSPTNPPSSQRPRELEEIDTNTAGFAIPNDILDEDERRPIGPDEGQQNMLVFDQRAIASEHENDPNSRRSKLFPFSTPNIPGGLGAHFAFKDESLAGLDKLPDGEYASYNFV